METIPSHRTAEDFFAQLSSTKFDPPMSEHFEIALHDFLNQKSLPTIEW